MSSRTARKVHDSFQPSIASYQTTPNKDSIKQKLKELKQFNSPSQIFYDIDTLFLLYASIKRQYNVAYKEIHLHKKKISASLKPENQNNTSTLSMQEISQAISNMNEVQTKLNDWIETVSNKTSEIQNPHRKPVENKNDSQEIKSVPASEPTLTRRDTAPVITAVNVRVKKIFNYNRFPYKPNTSPHYLTPRHKKRKRRKKIMFDVQNDDYKRPEKYKDKNIAQRGRKKAQSFFSVSKEEVDKVKNLKNRTPAAKERKQANKNNDLLMSSQLSQTKNSSNTTGS